MEKILSVPEMTLMILNLDEFKCNFRIRYSKIRGKNNYKIIKYSFVHFFRTLFNVFL